MFGAGRVRRIGGAALALVSTALVSVLVSQPAMAATSVTRTMAWNNTAPSLIRPNTDYTTLQTATRVPAPSTARRSG